jgi:hypothetical protein
MSSVHESKASIAVSDLEDLVNAVRDYGELLDACVLDLGTNQCDDRIRSAIARLALNIRDTADEIEEHRIILWNEFHGSNPDGYKGPHLVA